MRSAGEGNGGRRGRLKGNKNKKEVREKKTGSLIINGTNQVLQFNRQLHCSHGNREAKPFGFYTAETWTCSTSIPTHEDTLRVRKKGHLSVSLF